MRAGIFEYRLPYQPQVLGSFIGNSSYSMESFFFLSDFMQRIEAMGVQRIGIGLGTEKLVRTSWNTWTVAFR